MRGEKGTVNLPGRGWGSGGEQPSGLVELVTTPGDLEGGMLRGVVEIISMPGPGVGVRTASASLYAPPHSGGMGIPCIEDEIDIARVTTAFNVLGADGDPAVRTVARGLLEEVARG